MVAEPFKNFINGETVRVAAAHLARHDARFVATRFCDEVIPQLDALELKARAMCVASALERHLAADFFAAADHLERALAPVPVQGTGIVVRSDAGLTGWFLWSAGEYVARRGLAHPERALECLRQLTQRFSAEFAIRPFLVAHESLVFETLRKWIRDDSEHVRRLASEGTRPRLPWGMQLPRLIADPSPSLPLLAALLDDTSEYVRRSVANHLNDIARDHPELVADWVERHLPGASMARQKLLKHASRTLIKRGHPRILQSWGTGAPFAGTVALTASPGTIQLGEYVHLAVTLTSTAANEQRLAIDYVVHHVKQDGRTTPKVFKGWVSTIDGGATVTLSKRHAIKPITTRRYYAGAHHISIQINGTQVADAVFELRMHRD
ncbi:DNA alkylation repair protein [Gemmatimonas sp.]|uniref:DNA alkylation repair protein n=1 Tax=Gemmatimonas sp. TaxID=1962908 RepID=UPI0033402D85